MARRVRLQVLDDSLPAGVEACCGNCRHATDQSEKSGLGNDDPRRDIWPLRCDLAELPAWSWMDEALKRPELASRLCVTIDGSDYHGELWMRPEFGCINWEPRHG